MTGQPAQSYQDPKSAAQACAQHICSVISETLIKQERAAFAISGGSTPKLLFEALTPLSVPWKQVDLFFVDERFVPPSSDESNYKLALEHLIRPAGVPAENVHRIPTEQTPEQSASAYAQEIRRCLRLDESKLPQFDIMHLGLGADAHTASLFPGDVLLFDRQGIAAAVFKHESNQWRITLVPGVLLAARNLVVLATGSDKRAAIHSVFNGPDDLLKYPAQILARHGRQAVWFLDRAAFPANFS